ncbi:MAG: 4-(cytidine 5'-diphospho)-2-C-methyl-D-erythritol kinase [Lachnospiraceae bacterium]|jgi:4-diphosphocytidyl-2-C-methyl-D-erythritol kinase|nr:4-(cytidine 5'-diphospho)-2-C-methyl-D-erythritol kinase [Lachnospiraceae bacterium]MCI1726110.1 4-(cytidine 5'-diphospho)-2-C-methyl-D-erythritol kinase [Lachnospiraceae bacterium]
MIIKAVAKVNLGLDVVSEREDGYHEVRMIMQTVAMHDLVEMKVTAGKPGIRLEADIPYIPTDDKNLAVRAAALLMEEFNVKEDGLLIRLTKFIPVAAGLAGGSADAAAALIGTNKLFGLGLQPKELMRRGKKIGADVPYCIMKGTALAEGIGEVLTQIHPIPSCFILIAKPNVSVSTKKVFEQLEMERIKHHPDILGMLDALNANDLHKLAAKCENILERVTGPKVPDIAKIERIMKENGALCAIMSGSGPSVFGIFEDEKKAYEAKKEILRQKLSQRPFVTRPYNNGGLRNGR